MIHERDNRKDYLFSFLIVGICLWAFSTVGAKSFSTNLRSKCQPEQIVSFSTNHPAEFLASINTFPFNGNNISINNFDNNTSISGKSNILILDTLFDTIFKSWNQKILKIKPEISKTSMDYILSSNKGVEYQSIS